MNKKSNEKSSSRHAEESFRFSLLLDGSYISMCLRSGKEGSAVVEQKRIRINPV